MKVSRTRSWTACALVAAVVAWNGAAWPKGGAAAPPPGPAGTVSGTVLDENGKPMPGAQVVLFRKDTEKTWKTTADARGYFSIKGATPGPAKVVARAKSHVPQEKDVRVPATGVAVVQVRLPLGVRFAGVVKDERDRPVPGARVDAYTYREDDEQGGSHEGTTTTAGDGTFTLDGLKPGQHYRLTVAHAHHLQVNLPGLAAKAGEVHETLDVTLEDAAWVTGVVLDPAGKPVSKVNVRSGDGPGDFWSGVPGWIRVQLRRFGLNIVVLFGDEGPSENLTDAAGRFTVGGLAAGGEAQIHFDVDGFFRASWRADDLEAGKPRSDVKIVLEPATAWVEGTVVDPDGAPVAGAVVTAQGTEGRAGEAKSDAKGRFRLERLRARKEVRLSAHADRHVPVDLDDDVALNSSGTKITLARSPRLKVRVLGPDGRVVPKVWVKVSYFPEGPDGKPFGFESEDETEEAQGDGGLDLALPVQKVRVELAGEGLQPHLLGPYPLEAGAVVEEDPVTLEKKAPEADDKPGK